MTTDDIKQFANDHFKLEEPLRLEWIDDTSANVIYSSPEVGLQALSAFTQPGTEEDASSLPAVRLRSAKNLSTHPDSVLQVRTATKADRKKPRAYEASRFYLMHPEHDPREKGRREFSDRRLDGVTDSSEGDYRRRGFDSREHRRRRDRDRELGLTADMYDDSDQRDNDLFPDGRAAGTSRLRNRSASPDPDRYTDESRGRFRERSPPHIHRNEGKELFPPSRSGGGGGAIDPNVRELFPHKLANGNLGKELFPGKNPSHRRSDAFDAADETAKVPVPQQQQQQSSANDTGQNRNSNVELFPESTTTGGTGGDGSNELNIRGSATAQDQGFSIRGAANGISIKGRGGEGSSPSTRELFPSKYDSNAGNSQILSDKLEGRGGKRKKAEDMFS